MQRAAEQELAAGRDRGPLHGMPFAVKDVFDVAGAPTRAGSTTASGCRRRPTQPSSRGYATPARC